MSDTDTTQPDVEATALPRLQYEGDPLTGLRVPELRVANGTLSRTLGRGIDCIHEATTPGEFRWDALAHVAWVINKRTDPKAMLGTWTGATTQQLSDALEPRPHDAPPPEPAKRPGEEEEPAPTADELKDLAREEGPTETTG